MSKKKPASSVNGRRYLRSLAHAFLATPNDNESDLAQIGFMRNEIVGADGKRVHVGVLPLDAALAHPIVVTRASARRLGKILEGYDKATKGEFQVQQDGLTLEILIDEEVVTTGYEAFSAGYVPSTWEERWVRGNPPEVAGVMPPINGKYFKQAVHYWKDKSLIRMRHGGGTNPVLVEVMQNDEQVALAYLLPDGHLGAQLPDPNLFNQGDGKKRGRSVFQLSLQLDQPSSDKPELH